MLSGVRRLLCLRCIVKPFCAVLLLLVAGQAVGQTRARVQEYTPPYEMSDKDLNPLYGRYEIYEVDRYRGMHSSGMKSSKSISREARCPMVPGST